MAVPGAFPVTNPEETLAVPGAELDHVPPDAELLSDVVAPAQTEEEPVIMPALGSGFTVTVIKVEAEPHELVTITIMLVVPEPIAVTIPPETVATDGLLLLHVAPDAVSVSVSVPNRQRLLAPIIVPASGSGLTVITAVAVLLPQVLVVV